MKHPDQTQQVHATNLELPSHNASRASIGWQRVVPAALAVALLILTWTGLVAIWGGAGLRGLALLLHMAGATLLLPAFALYLFFTAGKWSQRFEISALANWCFAWGGLASIWTAFLFMLPHFGTQNQLLLIWLHRCIGLLTVCAALGTWAAGKGEKFNNMRKDVNR